MDLTTMTTFGSYPMTVTRACPIITTIVGTGVYGFIGDGVPGTSAQINNPTGVAADAAGNLIIADMGNHRVRKWTAGTSLITTIVGTGIGGFGGDGGAGTSAELYYPTGVAVDAAGNAYIADQSNQRIRVVVASTGIITTIAGNGVGGFSGDGGTGTSAELTNPTGVAVDAAGNVYIADYFNQRIRMVNGGVFITPTQTPTYPSSTPSLTPSGSSTSSFNSTVSSSSTSTSSFTRSATSTPSTATVLQLRVAGTLMIDLSAADYNATTNLWDNRVTSGAVSTANGDFGVINFGSSSDLPPTKTLISNVTAVYFPDTSTSAGTSLSTFGTPSATGSVPALFNPMYGTGPWSMESMVMQVSPTTTSTATEVGTESPLFQWGARGANTCNGAFLSLGHHPIWGAGGFFNCDIYWSAGESGCGAGGGVSC